MRNLKRLKVGTEQNFHVECNWNCDILQDLEYEGEHDVWGFPCLSCEVKTPIWKKTWVGEASFKDKSAI